MSNEAIRIIKRIDSKLDVIEGRLDSMDKTLSGQAVSLKYHIKRTNLLEKIVWPLRQDMLNIKFLFKAMAWIAGVATSAVGLIQYWAQIKSLLSIF